jgi:addiction module HigA family antidote
MKKTVTTPYDVADHLRTSEEMAAYLETCLEEADGDLTLVTKAFRDIARAKGITQVAHNVGLSSETLNKRTVRPAHPGEVLADLLEDLAINQIEFAQILGISHHDISQIIEGHQPVTVDIAIRLGKALGNGPQLWLNLQQKVDLWDALQANRCEYDRVKIIA